MGDRRLLLVLVLEQQSHMAITFTGPQSFQPSLQGLEITTIPLIHVDVSTTRSSTGFASDRVCRTLV